MIAAPEKIAFWLLPAAEMRAVLTSLVERLAKHFGAPSFEPHVTLQVAEVDEQAALGAVRNVCASAGPIELAISGIEFSPQYTKTLYLQFRQTPVAHGLSEAVREALPCTSDYQFNPHLSLLYKDLPEEAKRATAGGIHLPFSRVEFDRVKVTSTLAEISTAADVAAWQTLGECPLTGGRDRSCGRQ